MHFFDLAFGDLVQHHISHQHEDEMPHKSEVVCSLILSRNSSRDQLVSYMYLPVKG